MGRSKWKGPYILSANKKKISRNLEITPRFFELFFKIHDGKTYRSRKIKSEMLGHKFGELTPTRANYTIKKKKKK